MKQEKEKSYENLVHFQADTYQEPKYAEHHRLTCDLMKEIRKHKFNTHKGNFRLFLNNPENKDLDVNYFRGMFSIGSIYLSRKKTAGKEIRMGCISIDFDWKNNFTLGCSTNSPVKELLSCFTEKMYSIENTKDGVVKDPVEFIQYCIDMLQLMVTYLINILTKK